MCSVNPVTGEHTLWVGLGPGKHDSQGGIGKRANDDAETRFPFINDRRLFLTL